MDLSNIKLTLMELCFKMQRNAYEIAKMEMRPPVSSQNMYPPVINSWLRACCFSGPCPTNILSDL